MELVATEFSSTFPHTNSTSLRAWIDQPSSLLYFESREHNEDGEAVAGGLGIERVDNPIEPVTWTERWDDRIRATSLKVESLAEILQQRGLVSV